jgi:hypothetical protein
MRLVSRRKVTNVTPLLSTGAQRFADRTCLPVKTIVSPVTKSRTTEAKLMQNHNRGTGTTRKQPMTLQLQQQWRKDGASSDQPSAVSSQPPAINSDQAVDTQAKR